MTRRIPMMLLCLVVGACAATTPKRSPLAISYRWERTLPLPPAFDDQPPAEISIQWEPGTLSSDQLEQLEVLQCLEWNRQPSAVERQQDSARFRCDKPLPPAGAAR